MNNGVSVTTNNDNTLITINIPMTFKKRGCKKTIVTPDGHSVNQDRDEKQDLVLLKTLVNAHKWQRMLDSGKYANTSKLCEGEGIAQGYISVVMRMVTLAPDIQEKILKMQCPTHLSRADFVKRFPVEWEEQRKYFQIS